MRQAALTIGISASAIVHLCVLMIPLGTGNVAAPTHETLLVQILETPAEPQSDRPAPSKRTKAEEAPKRQNEALEHRTEEPAVQPSEKPAVDEAAADVAADAEKISSETQPEFSASSDQTVVPSDTREIAVNFGRVVSYLRELVERRKVYPMLARQRGFEGEVLLGFRVVDDGAIRSVHVARSSGNRMLDQSALQTLKQIERITPELWHVGTEADLQLSVVYRLIGS